MFTLLHPQAGKGFVVQIFLTEQALHYSFDHWGWNCFFAQILFDFHLATRSKTQKMQCFMIGALLFIVALELLDLGFAELLAFVKAQHGIETERKRELVIQKNVDACFVFCLNFK